MADFDITSLLANSAKTNADFDFSKLATAYYEGQKQQYEQRTRDAFQDPSLYGPDGQIDPYKAVQAALKAGGTAGVEPAAKVAGIADILSKFGNTAGLVKDTTGNAKPSYYRDPLEQNPPSISGTKGAPTPVAPDLTNRPAPTVRGGGDKSGSLVTFLDSQGVAPEDQGNHIVNLSAAISKATGKQYDPNTPLDRQDPRVRAVLADWIRNPPSQAQTAPPPPAPPPPQQPPQPVVAPPAPGSQAPIVPTQVQTQTIRPQASPQQAPQLADPTLNGLISQRELQLFGTPQNVLAYLEGRLRQGLTPDTQKTVQEKVDKITAALALTGEQKNAQTPGAIANLEGAKTEAQKTKEADVKEQTDLIDAGRAGSARLGTLNTLTNIIRSDPSINLGFGGTTLLKTKMALEALGVPMPDLSGPQAIQKLNAALAVEMAKSLTSRTTQFEFKTFLANNPGLELDRRGNERLIGIFSQLAQRDADLGKLARANRGNWDNWDNVVLKYDETHPVRDPVTNRVLSNNSVIAPAPTDIPPSGPAKSAAASNAATQPAAQRYTRAQADAAVANGTLKKGDTFLDNTGTPRKVE